MGRRVARKKQITFYICILIIIACATIGMLAAFFYYSHGVHEKQLAQEMSQITEMSEYITKIIYQELEHGAEILELEGHEFDVDKVYSAKTIQQKLEIVQEQTEFHVVGLMDRTGQVLDSTGSRRSTKNTELLNTILAGNRYISNILAAENTEEKEDLLIAVPLWHQGEIKGAIWGHYPVDKIAEKLELTERSAQYFQIIDDNGTYISRSNNAYSFAHDLSLWEELRRYEIGEDVTIGQIREKVKRHQSGTFSFTYGDQSRYVAYTPLGINNWYVFSVLVGEKLQGHITEVNRLSMQLLVGFGVFLTVLFSCISIIGYQGQRIIKQQNRQLEIKNKLFHMIMHKTQDILFEIDLRNKTICLYGEGVFSTDGAGDVVLEDFSPETMLKAGHIHAEELAAYRTIYNHVMHGEKVDGSVLQIQIGEKWEWKRIHLLQVSSDAAIGFLEDYNEQALQSRKLEEIGQKAKYDVLTGLYMREAFIEAVEAALQNMRQKEQDTWSALYLLDLDHFKEVNDTFGHIIGDQLLHEIGVALRASIRNTDVAGRLGGDEFVLFIQNAANVYALHRCAQKLNQILIKRIEKDGEAVTVSASIGIAVARPGMTFQELYEEADKALYQVKEDQRNGYKIADLSR